MATRWWKICLFVLTWSTNVTDGRTDRQTEEQKNRQTPHDSIDRACIASRGKNASQHVPVYIQQFPSYSNHNCKKSQSRKTLHEWKDNSVLAKPLAACTYLFSIVSELTNKKNSWQIKYVCMYTTLKSMRKSKNRYFYHIFVSPGDAPAAITLNVVRMEREFSQHVPIYLEQFPSYSNRKCKKSPFSRTAAHIFVSPGDASATITLAKLLAACTYLSSIVSELYDA